MKKSKDNKYENITFTVTNDMLKDACDGYTIFNNVEGIGLSGVYDKIKDKQLKESIIKLKNLAVKKKQYELAYELRELERKYFVTKKSKQ